jgi:acetylornithine deacetylase/succinyl-diaminopimelate desuccinylase-like protein
VKTKASLLFTIVILVVTSIAIAAPNETQRIRAFVAANEQKMLTDYLTFLAIPNVASDTQNIQRNTEWISNALRARGLQPLLLKGEDAAVPPVVYAEWRQPAATRTLLLYAHYDGQPVTPKDWTITQPWHPILRLPDGTTLDHVPSSGAAINPESRIFGRSSSDDKAGVFGLLSAIDALRATKSTVTSNLKFVFEGEEEAGSPHLNDIIRANHDLLKSDLWIMCDGPVHQSGRKQVVFGVRGDVNVDVTVFGPRRPLHSGHYGNWAPNPAMKLTRLLASMQDENGKVTIAGWYDDVKPLNDAEKRALTNVPAVEGLLQKELGLAKPDGSGKSLVELLQQPSLNINGMTSAQTGKESRNVIPTTATAALDLRLVLGNDYNRQVQKLIAHIQKQGYFVIDRDPTDEERQKYPLIARVNQRPGGYNAQRTPMDLPIARLIADAVQSTSEETIVKLPSLGGSLPLSIITQNTGVPAITIPIVNYDNNQHAEDENLRLQNLWDGIETYVAIMSMK